MTEAEFIVFPDRERRAYGPRARCIGSPTQQQRARRAKSAWAVRLCPRRPGIRSAT